MAGRTLRRPDGAQELRDRRVRFHCGHEQHSFEDDEVDVVCHAKVVLGYDKAVGTALVNASPEWLTSLTNQL